MLTPEVEYCPEEDPSYWQSDASLAEVEPRMDAMQRLVYAYEMPLLDALQVEYGEKIAKRGWLVCGPASIVLANLLHEDTGIPLLPFNDDPTIEHLRMEMYMFNAYDDPALPRRVDHTNLQYQTGRGFRMTIDPVYQLLWRKAKKEPGATLVEWHYGHRIRADMQTFYNLRTMFDLSVFYARIGNPDVWGVKDGKGCYQDATDMLRIMHSSQVFDDVVQTRSGDIIETEFWGQRLVRVMRAVRQQVPRCPIEWDW